jgi:hypothetical protein
MNRKMSKCDLIITGEESLWAVFVSGQYESLYCEQIKAFIITKQKNYRFKFNILFIAEDDTFKRV